MRFIALAVGIALAGTGVAQSASIESQARRVESRTLKNGLQVLVWPDHDIPNVSLFNWYRVGARNERPGITGLSHYFEHMMFNGTKTRPPGEFDRVMEANGGSNNAYTTEDVTVYMDWFPRDALGLIFELEADRMRNLDFDPKVVESERGVVHSERRLRVDNDNTGALFEQLQATMFVAHPYQFPVIGWPSDIESWKLEDLKRYYQTYYAPNNAVMIVVGDVEPAAVFALAEQHLAPIPSQPLPDPVVTKEPPQQGERRIELKRPGQTPVLAIGWHGLAAADREMPALELLMTALAQGESSRLHRLLVEEQRVAVSVDSYLQQGFDPGALALIATLPPGGDLARVEQLLDQALDEVRRNGISAAELAKARSVKLAGFWRRLAEIDGKASLLGHYAVMQGDWRKLFAAPARYEAVTRDEVRAVAQRLLTRDRRTVGRLLPQTGEE